MAQWGNKDSKTSSGTITITKNADGLTGNVTGSGTTFQTQAAVGDVIVAAGNNYVITQITSNTAAKVVSGIHGADVVAQAGGTAYTLSEKPVSVALSEASEGANAASIYGNLERVYGVDVTEMQAVRDAADPRPAHAGWVRKITGTGGRAGRVSYEVLVAGSSITGDADDDTSFPDYSLKVTVQPGPATGNSSDNESVTFSVGAKSTPAGATLAYLWQYTTEVGNLNSWATTAAVSGFSGQTTNTLTVNTAVIADGTMVRALVSTTGAANAVSDAAALTVTS